LESLGSGQQHVKAVLVGGFNPFEKYDRQNGNLPQIGVKKRIFETTTQPSVSKHMFITKPLGRFLSIMKLFGSVEFFFGNLKFGETVPYYQSNEG